MLKEKKNRPIREDIERLSAQGCENSINFQDLKSLDQILNKIQEVRWKKIIGSRVGW